VKVLGRALAGKLNLISGYILNPSDINRWPSLGLGVDPATPRLSSEREFRMQVGFSFAAYQTPLTILTRHLNPLEFLYNQLLTAMKFSVWVVLLKSSTYLKRNGHNKNSGQNWKYQSSLFLSMVLYFRDGEWWKYNKIMGQECTLSTGKIKKIFRSISRL